MKRDESMLDDPRVRQFEDATVDLSSFHHREHLYIAHCYLRALPLEEALARFVRHLRRLAEFAGAPRKFHATMTWAYMVLLHEAMQNADDASFEALLERCPALLHEPRRVLLAHYDEIVLCSEQARQYFILPRRRSG